MRSLLIRPCSTLDKVYVLIVQHNSFTNPLQTVVNYKLIMISGFMGRKKKDKKDKRGFFFLNCYKTALRKILHEVKVKMVSQRLSDLVKRKSFSFGKIVWQLSSNYIICGRSKLRKGKKTGGTQWRGGKTATYSYCFFEVIGSSTPQRKLPFPNTVRTQLASQAPITASLLPLKCHPSCPWFHPM